MEPGLDHPRSGAGRLAVVGDDEQLSSLLQPSRVCYVVDGYVARPSGGSRATGARKPGQGPRGVGVQD